jgi:two-component system, NtrC family, sensor kinase
MRDDPLKILVADDDPTTRAMLSRVLAGWGYVPVPAVDGDEAWRLLNASAAPRLAILDWQMPGLDGIAVCRALRGDADRAGVYALLLSAHHEREDVLNGLEAGADDFIAKPWDPRELRSRIRSGERILRYQDDIRDHTARLTAYAEQMEKLAASRARQLLHADRMATLGVLSAGVAHEINNPATFVAGNARLLGEFWDCARPILAQAVDAAAEKATPQVEKLRFVLREFPASLAGIENGVQRIGKIVQGLKRYARQDTHAQRRACSPAECVDHALELCHNRLKYRVQVNVALAPDLPAVWADPQQIEQALINLITNAADAIEEQEGAGRLYVGAAAREGNVELVVEDSGPGFSQEAQRNLFRPFFTTKSAEQGTGLGLSIAQNIVIDHGGEMEAGNRPEGGARIVLRLPAAGKVEG